MNWKVAGAVFPHRPDWASGSFWAPEISKFKGRYHVYYVARQKNGVLSVAVATADAPGGPYTDCGPLVSQADGSIDPVPSCDEKGDPYLIWKEDGNSRNQPTPIWAQRLTPEGTKVLGEPVELIRNTADWEGSVVEGPFILRRGDWFYLFYSGNGCCGPDCNYALGVARSHSLLGPWQKNPANPILAANETWKCPGHGSIVSDPQGRFWLLYHAYASGDGSFSERQGMLDEVSFGPDDWPTINSGKGPSITAPSPFGVAQKKAEPNFTDLFSGETLRPEWKWSGNRAPICKVQGGRLTLTTGRPGSTNLVTTSIFYPARSIDFVATSVVDLKTLKPGCAAGVCAFGDYANAMGILVCDRKVSAWRREKGDVLQSPPQDSFTQDKVYLRLTIATGNSFEFAASSDGKQWTAIGEGWREKHLPPQSRTLRVALTAGAIPSAEAQFESFSLVPNQPQPIK